MRIAVAGAAFDTAAEAFASGNLRAVDTLDDLATGLAAGAGMGGDDASSADFVEHYDRGARETCAAIGDLAAAFASMAHLTDASMGRHRAADHHATGSVRGGEEWVGRGVGDRGVVVPDHLPPPSALGADSSATPELWDLVVDHLQGWAWPSADVDRLHRTATLWRATGHRVRDLAADLDVGGSALLDQRSPEVPLALAAVDELRGHCDTLASACADLAEACADHADRVEQTRQAVRDLLQGLAVELAASAVMSGALSLITFGGSAVAYAGYATARAVVCARRVVELLKDLRLIKAVKLAADTVSEARGVAGALEKYRNVRITSRAVSGLEDSLWSPGKYGDGVVAQFKNVIRHAESHLDEFPDVGNADEYAGAAKQFLRDPPWGTLTRVRARGDRVSVLRYHEDSNTLAVMDVRGRAATMYRPEVGTHQYETNLDYFLKSG